MGHRRLESVGFMRRNLYFTYDLWSVPHQLCHISTAQIAEIEEMKKYYWTAGRIASTPPSRRRNVNGGDANEWSRLPCDHPSDGGGGEGGEGRSSGTVISVVALPMMSDGSRINGSSSIGGRRRR